MEQNESELLQEKIIEEISEKIYRGMTTTEFTSVDNVINKRFLLNGMMLFVLSVEIGLVKDGMQEISITVTKHIGAGATLYDDKVTTNASNTEMSTKELLGMAKIHIIEEIQQICISGMQNVREKSETLLVRIYPICNGEVVLFSINKANVNNPSQVSFIGKLKVINPISNSIESSFPFKDDNFKKVVLEMNKKAEAKRIKKITGLFKIGAQGNV